jgi:hypothetical protein
MRLRLQSQELERKAGALEKIDQRELATLERDERVLARGGDDWIPSPATNFIDFIAGPLKSSGFRDLLDQR